MDTQFAKTVSTPDGRYSILIDGIIISLDVADRGRNNELVETLVRGLRVPNGGLSLCSPLTAAAGSNVDQQAA